ncbi:MAG TPA: (2Fe-2S)-binding protein [Myxococcota bacterium]|nr:(2Fe-2S)-binding protein [Myxococcota bacterium]HRY91824.1 (2Fe-2S)-binding protein [Myxococcota bacterium]HSA21472.1 (2Fe-2S)-binding protein [Myxococcota bacterium]
MAVSVNLKLNGAACRFEVEPDERLVETVREKAGLTGTKLGCGVGECGACSVLLDGKLVCACLVLAAQADGCEVFTVEGLAPGGRLSDLQRAFVEEGAVQCGYCTPGMLMAAEALLRRHKRPTGEQIRQGLAGNLCRCTGYTKIVAAVRKVAKRRAARGGRR